MPPDMLRRRCPFLRPSREALQQRAAPTAANHHAEWPRLPRLADPLLVDDLLTTFLWPHCLLRPRCLRSPELLRTQLLRTHHLRSHDLLWASWFFLLRAAP